MEIKHITYQEHTYLYAITTEGIDYYVKCGDKNGFAYSKILCDNKSKLTDKTFYDNLYIALEEYHKILVDRQSLGVNSINKTLSYINHIFKILHNQFGKNVEDPNRNKVVVNKSTNYQKDFTTRYHCTTCNHVIPTKEEIFKFCPNCGLPIVEIINEINHKYSAWFEGRNFTLDKTSYSKTIGDIVLEVFLVENDMDTFEISVYNEDWPDVVFLSHNATIHDLNNLYVLLNK